MHKLALALALATVPVVAHTQTRPAPADTNASAAKPALNGDTPIEAIIADPAGKKVMDKDLPDLQKHPAFEQIKGMSLRQVQPYSNGAISDELIVKVEADLAAAKKAD